MKKLAKKYPEVLDFKSNKLSIKEKELPFYDVYEAIVAESEGTITLDYKDDYIFFIESWQQLTHKEIASIAIDRFNLHLVEVKKLVKGA